MSINAQGEGVVLDIVLGTVGAVIGGFIFNALGKPGVTGLNIWSFVVATIGAIIVLALTPSPHAVPSERVLPAAPSLERRSGCRARRSGAGA